MLRAVVPSSLRGAVLRRAAKGTVVAQNHASQVGNLKMSNDALPKHRTVVTSSSALPRWLRPDSSFGQSRQFTTNLLKSHPVSHIRNILFAQTRSLATQTFTGESGVSSKQFGSFLQRFTKLLSKPVGFGNFYPKEDAKSEEKGSKSAAEKGEEENSSEKKEEEASNSGSGGSGNNNDDKKGSGFPDMPDNMGIKMLVGTIAILYLVSHLIEQPHGQEITWQEFRMKFLETGQVERLVVSNKQTVYVSLRKAGASDPGFEGADAKNNKTPSPQAALTQAKGQQRAYYFTIGSVEAFERQLEQAQRDLDIHPADYVPVQYVSETGILTEMRKLLPSIVLFGLVIWAMRSSMGGIGGGLGGGGGKGRNIFSIGKSGAQMIKPGEKTQVTFKDVAGLDEPKVEVMEFVKFLKNPAKFKKLGAKIPKGALLVGPPGTGKTMLAKAVAGEASVPFFSISGSDFIEMFVGVGPSRVRDLFQQARQNAPCIIFIDEIDAVGRKRGSGRFSGANDERENTLNQLLVEMDGFQTAEGVVVLAGTNRADILDQALLRPGRFDRMIQIDKPDLRGRVQIFEVYLKKLKVKIGIPDLASRLAALTPGFAGADIANICNEAALIAARHDKEKIELVDFEAAIDRVIGGLEKKHSVMTKDQKKLVAYHEAGHAVAGWFLEHADPLLKVTIVPRSKGSLGWAQYLPKELGLYTKSQLYDQMCVAMGGRCAEQSFFGEVSSGAADDLKKITKLAYHQISVLGMGSKLGNLSFPRDEEGDTFTKPFSEKTAQAIDDEANQMVAASFSRTLALLEEKKALVEALAIKLLEVESVNHDVLVSILGPRPFVNDVYAAFLKTQEEAKRKEAEEAAAAAAKKAADAASSSTSEKDKKKPETKPDTDPILSPA